VDKPFAPPPSLSRATIGAIGGFQLMHERFEAVIERATGRGVIGFMSGNQQDPVMICGVTFLAHGPSGRRIDPRPGRPRTAGWRGVAAVRGSVDAIDVARLTGGVV
jgi:hypothetical protein